LAVDPIEDKLYGVETTTASIIKTSCLVAK